MFDDKLFTVDVFSLVDQTFINFCNADLRQIKHFKAGSLGAKVINCQRNTSLFHFIQQTVQGFLLNVLRRFRDLKDKLRRVSTGLGENLINPLQKVWLHQCVA